MDEKLIVAGDFGNSKIAVAVALKKEENKLQMVDFRKIDSNENLISNGKIVDNAALASEVIKLINQIEADNNLKIGKIHFAVAPHTLRSEIRKISIERSNPNLRDEDNKKLIEAAEDVEISDDRCVFDVVELETVFNNKAKGSFLIITSQNEVKEQFSNFVNNSLSAYNTKYFIAPLIEAEQFLSSEQKENGTLLVDFGAGCTSFAMYQGGFPRLCAVIPLGSKHITKDIQQQFNISENSAERLKSDSTYGLATKDSATIKTKEADIDSNLLKEIIYARLDEIFKFVFDELKCQKNENITEIVLVGGGADMLFLPNYLRQISRKEVKVVNFSVETNSKTKNFICNENALLFALLKNCNEDCSKIEVKPVLHEVPTPPTSPEKPPKPPKQPKPSKYAGFIGGLFDIFRDTKETPIDTSTETQIEK